MSETPASRRLRRTLTCGLAIVASLGLAAEVWYALAPSALADELVPLLSLSYEQNVPTAYSSGLLFGCAALLVLIARGAEALRAHWWGLAVGFTYMAIDEALELHEHLGGLVGGDGIFYFDWVIPAGLAVAAVGVSFLPFLARLPAATRRRFVLAGAVYLGGALVMELPLGYVTERHGDQTLAYAVIDFAEETLEMLGASLFLLALWRWHEGAPEPEPPAPSPPVEDAALRSRYLVSPLYDWCWFLLPPFAALCLGIAISGTALCEATFEVFGFETTAAGLAIGTIIHGHLVAVLFRSHANPTIFRLYPVRFVAVPIALWIGIMSSAWLAVTATVVATFWDVWHSGAQTFGFARIYDRNAGIAPHVGRRLDFWMNQLLYAGPILAGVTLADHTASFDSYDAVGATLLTAVPAHIDGVQRYLTWAVITGGTLFTLYYAYAHLRLYRAGHRLSPLKLFLVSTTGLCSIYTWGFNSWGEAFVIMNLFHAVQYLALVWATERRRMTQRLRAPARVTLAAYLLAVLAYGFVAEVLGAGFDGLWAFTIVVSLMHFWYDGFVWSVRKQQV